MRVKVKLIGIPKPPPGFHGQKKVPVEFHGNLIKDLIQHLLSEIDSKFEEVFLNAQGKISPVLAIIVNGIAVSYSNRSNLDLKESNLAELVSSPG